MSVLTWPSSTSLTSFKVPFYSSRTETEMDKDMPKSSIPWSDSRSRSHSNLGSQKLRQHSNTSSRKSRWTSKLSVAKCKFIESSRRNRTTEEEDRDQPQGTSTFHYEQYRKGSSSTTITSISSSSTATTLLDSPTTLQLFKDNEKDLSSLGKNLSSASVSTHLRHPFQTHQRLPETEDERIKKRTARDERKRDPWGWVIGKDEVGHEGDNCGWQCEVHRYRWGGVNRYADWKVVVGMWT